MRSQSHWGSVLQDVKSLRYVEDLYPDFLVYELFWEPEWKASELFGDPSPCMKALSYFGEICIQNVTGHL